MPQQEYHLPAPVLGAALRERLCRGPTLCWMAGNPGQHFEPGGAGEICVGDIELEDGAQLRCRGGGRIRIGNDTYVGQGSLIHAEQQIVIGTDVKIAWDVVIADSVAWCAPTSGSARAIHIGDGAWIGAGAIVLGGADIGARAIIGAGAVVRGRVEPGQRVPGGDLSAGRNAG